jgi:hypothetical protein
MSKLQNNLKENKHKIKREKFLSALDPEFSNFLASAEFSSDDSCLKYAAFPRRDSEAPGQRTTRGKVTNWNNFTFRTWQELISALGKFQQVKNYIGWFFIDADGPYYKVSVNAFLAHIKHISQYGTAHEHYDFGWVGAEDDVGIIIGYDHASTSPKKFAISMWGI